MLKLSWEQAAGWRARRHHLEERAGAGSMLAVAGRICGLHAQVLSAAELSVWARVEDLQRGAVPRALWRQRTLVKTWAMRGTLHLLTARDLPLWHAALSTSRRYDRPLAWRRFGLTMKELQRLTEAIGDALDGRVMTREELAREVARITGSAKFGSQLAQGGWGTVLKPAAFTGRLCFAPSVGQRVRFTHPSSWLKKARQMDPETSQLAIARRFLAAYGPATYHDLARWWGGGGVANAKQWIAALGEEVRSVNLGGERAWMLAADAREARELSPQPSVRLLPAFDHYVVAASRHANHLLPGNWRACVYRPQGWISAVLLVNGFMQGTWRHEIKGSHVEVVITPFVKQPAWVRRAAGEEAERLAAFFGGSLSLAWR